MAEAPAETIRASDLSRLGKVRSLALRFYRDRFEGRQRNYPLWEALYRLRSVYGTARIHWTGGQCLPQERLVVRDTFPYDQLFTRSSSFFEETMGPFRAEIRSEFWLVGSVYNEEFSSCDAEFYHCMIRRFRPGLVIEIGAGHSTRFAARALRLNAKGSLVCIDPAPRRVLPPTATAIQKKVEDVDPAVFDDLRENDILFIDSSHSESEATYHVDRILPRLRPGVLIHHHDVVYPYVTTYPEEEVLLAFYTRNPREYEVLAGVGCLRYHEPGLLQRFVPSFSWNVYRAPGSLWVKKRGET